MSKEVNVHDPVELWKRASVEARNALTSTPLPLSRGKLGEHFSGERSMIWTSLSQMAPADQAKFMNKLVVNWPYKSERCALTWPLHAGIIANCITSSVIATRISADMFLLHADAPFFDGIHQCPKSPLFLGIYTSGVVLYIFHQMFIYNNIYRENKPCSSCVLSQSVFNALLSGIVVPMFSLPYLSYYVILNRKTEKYPRVRSYIDFLTLSWEGSRATWKVLPQLTAFQVLVAAVGSYFTLWGRNRIFDSMDADPDLVRETMIRAQDTISWRLWLDRFLMKIPFFGRLITNEDNIPSD
uniref:Transmembrane protein n=1 Tax=Ascaris lumbricoides TaxID=6252 RepID=A0A0M3I0P4_ASCLU